MKFIYNDEDSVSEFTYEVVRALGSDPRVTVDGYFTTYHVDQDGFEAYCTPEFDEAEEDTRERLERGVLLSGVELCSGDLHHRTSTREISLDGTAKDVADRIVQHALETIQAFKNGSI
ncbi:mothers against decapentaplegic-like protein [Caudoviricetes sp.]|nr:mothers against decapentaplegic-like protein [Caudoviricetes sp.]UOF82756.1 mothers against decapentaplegic-like protein [Caudoviricetes sp.]